MKPCAFCAVAQGGDAQRVYEDEATLAFLDHSPLRNGTDWIPGPKRFALETGEGLRRVDEYTFQVVRTGEILRAHQLTQ